MRSIITAGREISNAVISTIIFIMFQGHFIRNLYCAFHVILETELLGDYSSLERGGSLNPLNDYYRSSWVDRAKGKKCRNSKLKSDQRLVYAKLNNKV